METISFFASQVNVRVPSVRGLRAGCCKCKSPADRNHTEFTYNALGQRVNIVERTGTTIGAGTITSTKQYAANEELDGTGTVTKKYFAQGEQRIVSGVTTSYFYTRDHLGSIREMIASDGSTISCRYSYDPYGRQTKVSGSIDCDFGFTGYYVHATSGLYLSATRPYDPNLGRFIQRDLAGEAASGTNLYAYVFDNPICAIDPSGLATILPGQFPGDNSLPSSGSSCIDSPPSNLFDPNNPPMLTLNSGGPYPDPFDQTLNSPPPPDIGPALTNLQQAMEREQLANDPLVQSLANGPGSENGVDDFVDAMGGFGLQGASYSLMGVAVMEIGGAFITLDGWGILEGGTEIGAHYSSEKVLDNEWEKAEQQQQQQ